VTNSEKAVRRLREESRLRVEGQSRRRSFAGWCAVATLASGISLAALDAHDAQWQAQEVARKDAAKRALADAERRRVEEMRRAIHQRQIERDGQGCYLRDHRDEERALIRARSLIQLKD
jgi:hypothetical protein